MSGLSMKHYVSNLKLMERNKEWWSASSITRRDKILYYGNIFRSYASGAKSVRYLGRRFYFDNPATPLNLQNYPYEISNKILRNMDESPRSVLDIGANIGQFSATLDHALEGNVKIDAFEPNPHAYDFLEKNLKSTNTRIRTYNYGIGSQTEKLTMYYNPKRSGIGSLIKQNAGVGADSSSVIKITAKPNSLTKRKSYDLIKIDVEGYEYEALKGLAALRTKYLFIEVSGVGRTKDYAHSELWGLLRSHWGEFDICYIGAYEKGNPTFDVLVKFLNQP